MNIDPAYENFLFYAFSDGWVQSGEFVQHARKFAGKQVTRGSMIRT